MNIAFVGLAGVPYLQRAGDIRIMSFSKSMLSSGNEVTIFNKYPIRKKRERKITQYSDEIKIVEIIESNPSNLKIGNWLFFILSYFREFYILIKFNKKKKIDLLHPYTGHIIDLIFYFIISKIIKAKVVYHYEEFRSVIKRPGLYHKLNGYLIDRYGHNFYHGVICISNYIENHIKFRAPNLPLLKVPPICDFDLFDQIIVADKENFILFCGSAGYYEVIKLVNDSYNASKCGDHNIELVLVINGSANQINRIANLTSKNPNIKIISNLSYTNLISYYKKAKALLIPIRNTIQDIARFPNKICEYTAAKAVIVTIGYGEIPYYFINELNAIIATDFTIKAYSDKLNWLIENESRLASLQNNAYELGRQKFDIKAYELSIQNFQQTLINRTTSEKQT